MCIYIYTHTQQYVFKPILFPLHSLPSTLVSSDYKLAGSDAVPVLVHLISPLSCKGGIRVFL